MHSNMRINKLYQLYLIIFFSIWYAVSNDVLGNILGKQPSLLVNNRDQAEGRDVPFEILQAEYYKRSEYGNGEIRITILNSGKEILFHRQLILESWIESNFDKKMEPLEFIYVKMFPPIVKPGQHGQLLGKLQEDLKGDRSIMCRIVDKKNLGFSSESSVNKLPVWISFIGFSQDLKHVYVHVKSETSNPISAQLIGVDGVRINTEGKEAINISPGDIGCLVGTLNNVFPGDLVQVVVLSQSGSNAVRLHRIAKVINRYPLSKNRGPIPSGYGLDSEGFTNRIMYCIAHNHGTPKEASLKFLTDYYRQFTLNPNEIEELWICKALSPGAWYQFGALPDVADMNPLLGARDQNRSKSVNKTQYFHPFLWWGHMAKRATEPGRYFACVDLDKGQGGEGRYAQDILTSQDRRFLAYCAVASGAKALLYRGSLPTDPFGKSQFIQLNDEIRDLVPHLIIAEPVDWATTINQHCAVQSLLCGNQAILVILFDTRYFNEYQDGKYITKPFSRSIRDVDIMVRIPDHLKATEICSAYETLKRNSWSYNEGKVTLKVNMIDSAQPYIIKLRPLENGL